MMSTAAPVSSSALSACRLTLAFGMDAAMDLPNCEYLWKVSELPLPQGVQPVLPGLLPRCLEEHRGLHCQVRPKPLRNQALKAFRPHPQPLPLWFPAHENDNSTVIPPQFLFWKNNMHAKSSSSSNSGSYTKMKFRPNWNQQFNIV